MKKRIASLILAVIFILMAFTACHDRKIDGEIYKGAELRLYLNEMVYELDPALCLNNDSALQVCSLIYETLFSIDEDGKLVNQLVKDYEIKTDTKNDEYKLEITLRSDVSWTDGTAISADDVVFAWKRILDPEFNSDAACLLYDIKNAKEAKAGDCSIDDVGIYADNTLLTISFDQEINYEAFLYNLTSIALAPLRESVVSKNGDWAKKPATTLCSGPFMLRRTNYGMDTSNKADMAYATLILERNPYYHRKATDKYIDNGVTPYKIIIDYSKTKEEVLTAYESGEGTDRVFYVGDIALSKRAEYKDTATVSNLLSTHTYYLNENAEIKKADGTTEKLFAIKNVRLALSKVIDRNALAEMVVFAQAATGFVPNGIFNSTNAKTLFRTEGGSLIASEADKAAAEQLLKDANIKASDYTFSVMVRSEDEVHVAIAEKVVEAWASLGFNVTVNKVSPEINDEKLAGEDVKDIYDDIFAEKFYANKYEVIAIDVQANAPYATSFLAPYATGYSGQGQDLSSRDILPATAHSTGFDNADYTAKIAAVYATQNYDERATLLHEAEQMLVGEMPTIPLLFNQQATLTSSDLKKVEVNYYGCHNFTDAALKNWVDYVETTVAEEEQTEPEA